MPARCPTCGSYNTFMTKPIGGGKFRYKCYNCYDTFVR